MNSKKAPTPQPRQLALLRGVNVGGKNRLPMPALAELFAACGCRDVTTYIQSGNVLFRPPEKHSPPLAPLLSARIAQQFGYRVPVILRSCDEMGQVVAANPFLALGHPEKTLHVYFLAQAPDRAAGQQLDPARSPGDAFQVLGREVYLYLPNGMARTKLTNAWFDSKLATTSSARNWTTTLKLFELMAS